MRPGLNGTLRDQATLRTSRRVALGGVALAIAGAAWTLAGGIAGEPQRGPVTLPNAEAKPAMEFLARSVRHVIAPDAPEILVPDTIFPTRPVRLLWLQGRGARPMAGAGSLALDGAGGVIKFGPELSQWRPVTLGGRAIVGAAAAGEFLWLTDDDGAVLRVDRNGTATAVEGPGIQYATVAADPRRDDVWLVRRSDYWEYRLPDAAAPLFVHLTDGGREIEPVGAIVVPQEQLLTDFMNAGHAAVAGDTVYFAPFIRDEIIAFSATGDTLWVTRRELPQSTAQPRFLLAGGTAQIDYHPVNLGVVVGPDDRLYVLSTPGFTTTEARLDVLDRFSGRLVRSAHLPEALPTLAADHEGRVYRLDPFRLLTGADPAEREAFAPFELERLGGGRMSQADLRGKVTLINFWASWCTPCRTEMPALDSLRQSLTDPEFQFLTFNEDVHRSDAEAFIREFGFDFPVLLGGGRLRQRYHYIGLPFTVLVDRESRVVQRWVGFAGPEQIQAIRALARAELDRPANAADGPASGSDGAAEQHRHHH
jgi:thiol-disulfide isomerase/thioredoxin